jgi:geranylgeranyl pyrophosphate synthase
VRGLLSHDETYQDRADEAVAQVRNSDAIDRSLARARAYAAAATEQLTGLADSPYLGALHDLARYVVERRD